CSMITRSLQSPKLLVKPQATIRLLPTGMTGVPGKLTPETHRLSPSSEFQLSVARYQVFGTESPRCISLATKALPPAAWPAATAQLLLPEDSRGSCGGISPNRTGDVRL